MGNFFNRATFSGAYIASFLLHMLRNGHSSYFGPILNPKLEIHMGYLILVALTTRFMHVLSDKRLV